MGSFTRYTGWHISHRLVGSHHGPFLSSQPQRNPAAAGQPIANTPQITNQRLAGIVGARNGIQLARDPAYVEHEGVGAALYPEIELYRARAARRRGCARRTG